MVVAPLVLGAGVHFLRSYTRSIASLARPPVECKLYEHEQSTSLPGMAWRYDFTQLASNDPVEDYAVHEQHGDLRFFGIFDGHGGDSTSKLLQSELVARCVHEWEASSTGAGDEPPMAGALKRAFTGLDAEITDSVHVLLRAPDAESLAQARPALSGSCALLAVLDERTRELTVALAGDSRAVLAEQNTDGSWDLHQLTHDQTASDRAEIARVREEHPGEPRALVNGRLLGVYQPTRSFGDGIAKWPRDVQLELRARYGHMVPAALLTPPYMTARPTTSTLKLRRPGFLVLASDGLFDELSSTEVVQLVVAWINRNIEAMETECTDAGRAAARVYQAGGAVADAAAPTAELGAALVDRNCATHVLRNALAHGSEHRLHAVLNMTAPESRRYRDDITIQVVFLR